MVGIYHLIVLSNHARLIIDKAFVKIGTQAHIHTRFPVIESSPLENTWDQLFETNFQIKNSVWYESESIGCAQPLQIGPAYKSASDQRIDVAISQDNETGAQGGQDLAFKAVNEVSSVE